MPVDVRVSGASTTFTAPDTLVTMGADPLYFQSVFVAAGPEAAAGADAAASDVPDVPPPPPQAESASASAVVEIMLSLAFTIPVVPRLVLFTVFWPAS
ncbi:hypothetical protein [Paraburkholderia sp. JHI869]|uniref:hypothetical protein n=1 Tax=Paraburkholderia sp. JHI869 TaxID=3112959 RepID=UPI00319E4034